MPRVAPLCALALLCASLVAGCGKKDDSDSGGYGGGASPDGQPVLRSRTDDDKKEARDRLRQIGLALHNFHDVNGQFPAGVMTQKGQLGLSWRVAILPYLEDPGAQSLYKQFKLDEPWDSAHNKLLVAQMPKVLEAPGALASNGKTFLRSFAGPHAFIPGSPPGAKGPPTFNPWANQPAGPPARGRPITGITDGVSNTLMVVEAAEAVEWTKPDELAFLDTPAGPAGGQTFPLPKLGFPSEGGFHALMCDGSVRFVKSATPEQILRALITVNGGEVASLDEPDDDRRPGSGGAGGTTKTDTVPIKPKGKGK